MSEILNLIRGVPAIAGELKCTVRAAYCRLDKRDIPGCFKDGGQWVMDVDVYRAEMRRRALASTLPPLPPLPRVA